MTLARSSIVDNCAATDLATATQPEILKFKSYWKSYIPKYHIIYQNIINLIINTKLVLVTLVLGMLTDQFIANFNKIDTVIIWKSTLQSSA